MYLKKTIWFISITFAFSWLLWIPDALIQSGVMIADDQWIAFSGNLARYGAWGPLVGAFICIWIFEGKSTLWKVLQGIFQWRMNKMLWLAIFIMPFLIGSALLIYIIISGESIPLPQLNNIPHLLIAFVFIFFLGGPLQEEFGWRGYLFQNLEKKLTSLGAGAFAGFIWGIWHLPLFFIPREEYYYNKPMWGLFLTTTLVGIILAWIYKRSNYRILSVLIAHAMFNWSNFVFPTLSYDLASLILFALYIITIIFILSKYNYTDFRPKINTIKNTTIFPKTTT